MARPAWWPSSVPYPLNPNHPKYGGGIGADKAMLFARDMKLAKDAEAWAKQAAATPPDPNVSVRNVLRRTPTLAPTKRGGLDPTPATVPTGSALPPIGTVPSPAPVAFSPVSGPMVNMMADSGGGVVGSSGDENGDGESAALSPLALAGIAVAAFVLLRGR